MRKSMMKFWSFLLIIIAESVVWKLQDLPPICQWFCWVKVVKLEGGDWLGQFVGLVVTIWRSSWGCMSCDSWDFFACAVPQVVSRSGSSSQQLLHTLEIWIFVPSHSSLAQHWENPVLFFDAGSFVIPLLFTSRKCVIFSLLFKVRMYSTLTRHFIRLVQVQSSHDLTFTKFTVSSCNWVLYRGWCGISRKKWRAVKGWPSVDGQFIQRAPRKVIAITSLQCRTPQFFTSARGGYSSGFN